MQEYVDKDTLLPCYIHSSWNKFLNKSNKNLLKTINMEIGEDFTPSRSLVLRFMQLDISNFKVVILGQDPYKPIGVATGRSFQPSNLIAWNQKFRQISLKNIIRLIHKNYFGYDYTNIKNYSDIVNDIEANRFPIKEPSEWFDSTEKQGVLWLNSALTCEIGVSNSHTEIWRKFTEKLISYITTENKNIIWFMWGKEAAKFIPYIKYSTKIYKSDHPMMCSCKKPNDFLKSNCFKDTWEIINWLG